MNPKLTPRSFQSKEKTLHNPPVYRPGKTDAAQQTARPALAAPPVYNPRSTAGTPPGHGSITPPVFGLSKIKTAQLAQALVKGPVCLPALPVAVQPKIVPLPALNRSVPFSIPRMNQLPKPPLPAFSTDSAIQLMKKNKKNKTEEKWQKLAARAIEYNVP